MKLKVFLVSLLVAFGFSCQAGNLRHMHQLSGHDADQKKMTVPGFCEIEVINRSFVPVHVTGQYLDGQYLTPFDIYPYDAAHYISVYYYGCQSGMNLAIQDFSGYVMYSGYTPVYQTIVIYPTFGKEKPKVKSIAK